MTKPLPTPNAQLLQWLTILVGFGFICAAGYAFNVIAGLAATGLSLIVIAFLAALPERPRT
jgi:hypothetical protein